MAVFLRQIFGTTLAVAALVGSGGPLNAAASAPEAFTPRLDVSTGSADGELSLHGGRDRRQLVVTLTTEQGEQLVDVTRQATYAVEPPTLATVENGLVVPRQNGAGQLVVGLSRAEASAAACCFARSKTGEHGGQGRNHDSRPA